MLNRKTKINSIPKKTHSRGRSYLFAARRIANPAESLAQAKTACGYSEHTTLTDIASTQGYRTAQDELREIAAACKCAPKDQLVFFRKARDGSQHEISDRITAAREINRMLPGYLAPQQVQTETHTTNNIALLLGMVRSGGASISDLFKRANGQHMVNKMDSTKQVSHIKQDKAA